MAVNKRILAGSLGAAVLISVGGGYLLSRSNSNDSTEARITPGTVYSDPNQIPTNKVVQGEKLPTVNLVDTQGNTVSTAGLIGHHPLVINIWAVTCEACKIEMPLLAKVQADVGDKVDFVGVDTLENTPSAIKFATDKGVKYQLLSDHNGELTGALGVTGLPYTLFISANGTIVAQKGIALDEATIRANVAAISP